MPLVMVGLPQLSFKGQGKEKLCFGGLSSVFVQVFWALCLKFKNLLEIRGYCLPSIFFGDF